jgi:hypothetical protein
MSRARRRTVKALVVLGSVLAFLSVFAIWVERQALNTNDWVDTSGRLIQNEEIRSAVASYLVDQLYANVNVEKELEGILPGETKRLAGPVSGGLRQVAGSGAEEVLKTSTAQELWKDANRAAHEQLLAVLENNKEAVSTANGEVTLNLGGMVTNLADQVGIGTQLAEKLPPDAGQVTILRSNQLKTAQGIVAGVKGLALLLSLLTLLCLGLAVYLSREGRWVTVLFCGVGLVAAGFAVIVFRSVAGGIVVGQLVKEETVKPAAEAAWSISTSLMVSIAATVIVFGVLAGIAGWLGSPTGSARASRRFMAPFLRDYAPYVYTGLVIVVCIYFLSGPTQNLRTFLTALIVGGAVAFGIHEMRRQSAEEFPDVQIADYFGGARERVAGAVRSANLGERAAKLRLPEMRRPPSEGVGEAEPQATPAAPAATAPPPSPGGEEDARLRRLEQLAALREKGVLTEEEFAAEKARVLGGGEA